MTSSRPGPALFISYRRDDAAAHAGRLCDWLKRQFGDARVFLDTDKIAPGDAFEQVLQTRLAGSDVLLAVIGPRWLDIADAAGRRLDQPKDYVRREIAGGLAQGLRVIPVLVGGARMPAADALPEPLRALAGRNAASLGDASFGRDFDALVDDILQRPRGYVRRELDRLQRLLRALKVGSLMVPALALAVVLAAWVSLLAPLNVDQLSRNTLLWLADAAAPLPADPGVLLVALDEASERALGLSPLGPVAQWRQHHVRLVRRAAAAGAKAVVFDLAFVAATGAEADLAEAARRAGTGPAATRVVVGAHDLDGEAPALAPALRALPWGSTCLMRAGSSYSVPLAVLAAGDRDDALVRVRLPALALAATQAGTPVEADVERRTIRIDGAQAARAPRFSTIERNRSDTCGTLRAGDDVAVLRIRPSAAGYWRDPARRVSYADALDANVVADARLHGRILLVGDARGNSRDRHTLRRGPSSRTVAGVELHAEAIATLLAGRETVQPTVDRSLAILVAMAFAGAATGFLAAPLSRRWRWLATAAVVALYLAVAVALAVGGLLLDVPYDLTAFAAAWAAMRHLQSRDPSWENLP